MKKISIFLIIFLVSIFFYIALKGVEKDSILQISFSVVIILYILYAAVKISKGK